MKRKHIVESSFVPLLGFVPAVCGIFVVSQIQASAASTNTWRVERITRDVTSIVAAGVAASVSAATYVPLTISLGPTVASGIAGSAGFATGGGIKIAGDYLVAHPKSALRNGSATLITGDITAVPSNIKAIVKSIIHLFTR